MRLYFLSVLLVLNFMCFSQEPLGTILNEKGNIIAFEDTLGQINMTEPLSTTIVDTVSMSDSAGVPVPVLGVQDIESSELMNETVGIKIHMTDEVTITDPTGAVLCVYNVASRQLIDMNGNVVFSLTETNEVRNAAGVEIGHIDVDGKVYANDGNLVGEGVNIDSFKLAYYFFYSNK